MGRCKAIVSVSAVVWWGTCRTAMAVDCRDYQDRFEAGSLTEPQALKGIEPTNLCLDYVLGLYHKSQRQFDLAFRHFHKAAEVNPDYHGAFRELGWLYDGFRQPDKARRYYESAIRLARGAQDLRGEAEALMDFSYLERVAGNLDQALSQLHEAQGLSKRIQRPDYEAMALVRMADVLVKLGDLSEAEAKGRQALEIRKTLNDPRLWSALNTLGDIYLMMAELDSEPDRAEAAAQKAIATYQEAQKTANHWDQKQMLTVNLGEAYRKRGNDAAALDCYQRFLSDSPEVPSLKPSHISALGGLGLIEAKRGSFDRALSYFEQAVHFAQLDKRKRLELSWRKRIGDLYAESGKYEQARACYDDVLREVRDGFLDLGSQSGGEGYAFFGEQLSVYEAAVDLLLKMALQHPEREYAREAFDYVERARAQSVLQALFESHIVERWLSGPPDSDFHRNLASLQNEAERLWRSRLEKRAERDQARAAHSDTAGDLESKIQATEAELGNVYKNIVRLIKVRLNNYELSGVAKSIQQTRLGDDETLVEYMVADEKTFVFLINKDHLAYEVLPIGRKGSHAIPDIAPGGISLSQALKKVSPLLAQSSDAPLSYRHIAARDADIKLRALQELYQTIFRPIEGHLQPGRPLIIVPDDLLYYLPFEMLVTKFEASTSPEYLLARYPMAYAYSADMMLNRSSAPDAPVLRTLLVGNPAVGSMDNGPNRAGRSLQPLPYTEREVRRVGEAVGKSVILTGTAATEAAFKREAGQAGLIHLATHSIFDRRNYLDSSIVFARDGRIDQGGEDGFLYMHEIMNLRLAARLVVMTGCETGSGRLRRGGGLEGISRAFWAAGVQSVMATLWPIADNEATANLTAELYRHLTDGMDKRQALQRAKLDLLAGHDFADPFYWAPLILVGDTARVRLEPRASTMPVLAQLAALPVLIGLAYLVYRRRTARAR